jgi:hypothetical protein
MRLTAVTLVVVASSGCAARFQGELDGGVVPPIMSAALGTLPLDGGRLGALGFAVNGDSCAEAVTALTLERSIARTADAEERVALRTELAEWHQRVLPVDQWRLRAQLVGDSEPVMRDATASFGTGETDVRTSLELCRSDGFASVEAGTLLDELTCFAVPSGAIGVDLADDRSVLRLQADEDPVEFAEAPNLGVASPDPLKLDVTFTACPALDTLVDDFSDGQPIEPECIERCAVQPDGSQTCEIACPDRGGEGGGTPSPGR